MSKPIFYKSEEEMEKPLSQLMDELRSDVARVRGKLYDIKSKHGWKDRIEHLEGGLTCMISAMHHTQEEWERYEEKNKLSI